MVEIAVLIMACAAVVMVAFMVPVLINLRKTAAEAERFLRRLNEELPVLLWEASQAVQNVNRVTTDVRGMTTHARVLGERIGTIGETINHVLGSVRSQTLNLKTNVYGWLAGFRAAYHVLKQGTSVSRSQSYSSQSIRDPDHHEQMILK